MPKYLFQASYTPEGVLGLMKDTASGRRTAVKAGIKSVGGKLESFYYSFGSDDVILIADLPDNVAAARVASSVAASGLVNMMTTPLISVEEMDKALSKGAKYRAPGQE
ncbi:MAG: GYD domain-containing protein [Acidobacteriota bacterium]